MNINLKQLKEDAIEGKIISRYAVVQLIDFALEQQAWMEGASKLVQDAVHAPSPVDTAAQEPETITATELAARLAKGEKWKLAEVAQDCQHSRQATTMFGAMTNTGWTCKDCGKLVSDKPAPGKPAPGKPAAQELPDAEAIFTDMQNYVDALRNAKHFGDASTFQEWVNGLRACMALRQPSNLRHSEAYVSDLEDSLKQIAETLGVKGGADNLLAEVHRIATAPVSQPAARAVGGVDERAECDGGRCGVGGYCKECPKMAAANDVQAQSLESLNEATAAKGMAQPLICRHCRSRMRPVGDYCPASTEDTRFSCQNE